MQIQTFKILAEFATFSDASGVTDNPPDPADLSGGTFARNTGTPRIPPVQIDLHIREFCPAPGVAPVPLAMNEFDACIRYLNTRRSAGAVINIESEADLQDVLYLLIRPWIIDLTTNRRLIRQQIDLSLKTSLRRQDAL